MRRLLLIVSRDEPRRYTYFRQVYDGRAVDVIFDRRVAQRRRRHASLAIERRRANRRCQDIEEDLQTFGWVLVRPRLAREKQPEPVGRPDGRL